MSVGITTYHLRYNPGIVAGGRDNLNRGLVRMATDIHSQAVMRAPKLTRALVNSGRFYKTGPLTWSVIFGNVRVPYARYREYVNHLHPWTTHYLQNSAQTVAANAASYFGHIV